MTTTTTPARTTTQSTVPAPTQSSSGGGMLSGIGSTIAQGMAFGTGSAIAHRAVGAVAGTMSGSSGEASMQEQQQAPVQHNNNNTTQLSGACSMDKQMFYECLQVNQGDQQACQFLYQQLQACQANETTFG